jgi:hypothetical protein
MSVRLLVCVRLSVSVRLPVSVRLSVSVRLLVSVRLSVSVRLLVYASVGAISVGFVGLCSAGDSAAVSHNCLFLRSSLFSALLFLFGLLLLCHLVRASTLVLMCEYSGMFELIFLYILSAN